MANGRKLIKVTVTLSVAKDVTKAHAKREVRTRVNDLTEHHSFVIRGDDHRQADQRDVRVRAIA